MEMEEQYGITDLRHLISRASAAGGGGAPPQFPPFPPQQPPEFFSPHHHHQPPPHYDMVVMGRHLSSDVLPRVVPGSGFDRFNSDSTTTTTTAAAAIAAANSCGFDGGTARWPRQETLTLLEVRSKLDLKFKEANQKGPLWDEVARIMSEEHGYQRSGKKCREKFENLYKYYKKTKEGKAGRQDGKHYRFFRQLEALYGEHHSSSNHLQIPPHFQPNNTSASPSISSDFEPSSSEDDEAMASLDSNGSKKKRKGKRSWKLKIKEFIDLQMRKIMEKQEAWLENMMKTLDKREQDRIDREEEWRKQECARIDREHKFWAKERAWIEARDLALMKALERLTHGPDHWDETEITRLIQVRTNMESRFEQCGFSEEVLWEDIAAKMAYFGYERSAIICKEKWDVINKNLQEKDNYNKKRKGKCANYGVVSDHNDGGLYMNNHVNGFNISNNCEINEPRLQLNDGSSSPSSHNSNVNVNASNVMNDSCLRFFLGDGDNLGWEGNYGVKAQQG